MKASTIMRVVVVLAIMLALWVAASYKRYTITSIGSYSAYQVDNLTEKAWILTPIGRMLLNDGVKAKPPAQDKEEHREKASIDTEQPAGAIKEGVPADTAVPSDYEELDPVPGSPADKTRNALSSGVLPENQIYSDVPVGATIESVPAGADIPAGYEIDTESINWTNKRFKLKKTFNN